MKVQLLEERSGFSMKLQASLDTPSLTPKTWLDRSLMQARIPVLEAQVSSTVKFAALAAQIGASPSICLENLGELCNCFYPCALFQLLKFSYAFTIFYPVILSISCLHSLHHLTHLRRVPGSLQCFCMQLMAASCRVCRQWTRAFPCS